MKTDQTLFSNMDRAEMLLPLVVSVLVMIDGKPSDMRNR